MELQGPFAENTRIDRKYTGEAEDVSPALSWSGAPAGTQSLVIICDDPDAPSPKRPAEEPWVHWVIYNIPASVSALPEGISRIPLPTQIAGARQGKNSWPSDNVGYRGPMPPPGSGTHRYFFKLFALDCEINLDPASATKAMVMALMRGHVVGEAQLIGTYERK